MGGLDPLMLVAYLFNGRQWRPFGRRVHHGLPGLVLAVVGVALMLDDILDCRSWIADFRRPRRCS